MPKKGRKPKKPPGECWFVYPLRCADGTLYTGIAKNVNRRCHQHNAGIASRYTRSRLPFVVVHQEAHASRSVALKREAKIKALSRRQKMALVRLARRSEGNESMMKSSKQTVLFLCTGNYYRSRFAEILFNSVAGKMGLTWRASSRGLALERGVNNVGPMAGIRRRLLSLLLPEHHPCRDRL